MICLPPQLIDAFKLKIKSGEITPEKLSPMSSAERRSSFSFLGDTNAKEVNALFESKLLLKNQQRGILNWAKEVAGLKPEVLKDIVSKVDKMTEILNPENERAFLEDLASHRLRATVTLEEAAKISELARAVGNAKENLTAENRMDYGRAKIAFDNYIFELKQGVKKPFSVMSTISNIGGVAKSLKATLDNSVIGRQGLKVLLTNPGIWLKNSLQTFVDIVKVFGGKAVLDEVKAEVQSRPNSLNGLYKKEKLAIGVIEEAYPSNLPERIPFIGRAFKASETAFVAFQYRTRADIFDKYVEIAQKSNADISGIGKIANSLTGRGSLGKLEPAADIANNIFFSPRLLKSNIDALSAHLFDAKMSPFARKQAAINTLKIISGIAAILTIADAVNPGSVQKDSRSADFGKIRVNDTRFDVTGGMSGLVVLASRLITMSSKSSITGNVTELNSGKFGSLTGVDIFYNFFENKFSPLASVFRDILEGKDFHGNKPTPLNELNNLLTPLPIITYLELKDNPNSANIIAAMIAETLGISANTYSLKTDWSQSTGVELQQFKQKVGEQKFQEANNLFNERFNSWFSSVKDNPRYTSLSEEQRQKLVTDKKSDMKDAVLKQYGFIYKRAPVQKLPKL